MAISTGMLLKERYKIESVLGQGGMGAVYCATDELLSIQVAVKENLFLAEEYTKQFQQEAKILAGLRHHSLPRVIDFCNIPGQGQYLIMDYIEGQDLRDLIKEKGRLSEHDVGLIGYHICDALFYMHQRDPIIIHRDIKPGNIKITKNNQIFLVDFGLAKVAESPTQMTITGARAMTPGYSPPEQYGTARTDERSDIYSLGATLYNALTGAVPEDALNRVTDRNQLIPILEHRNNTEQKLVKVIEKAMEIDPEDRFQDVKTFQEALLDAVHLANVDRELKQLSVLDSDESELLPVIAEGKKGKNKQPQDRKSGKRTTIKWGYAIAVIFVLVSLSLLSFSPEFFSQLRDFKIFGMDSVATEILNLSMLTSPTQTDVLPTENVNELVTREVGEITVVQENTLTVTPETLTTPVPSSTSEKVEESQTQTLEATPTSEVVDETPLAGDSLEPESDEKIITIGSDIVFASTRSGSIQLWLMDTDGGNTRQLTEMPNGACQPDWSPDGSQIVFISPCRSVQENYPEASLYLYDFEENSVFSLMSVDKGDQRFGNFDPVWSPDGSEIAFTSVSTGLSHIYTFNISTTEIQEISNSPYPDRQPSWHPDGQSLLFMRNQVNWAVWMVGIDGNGLRQLSWSGEVSNYSPVWAPDGKLILFSQSDESNIPWLVKLYEANFGTTLEDNIYAKNVDYQIPILGPKYGPIGERIVFESWPDGRNHDIYSMNIDGTELIRLTTHPDYDFDPDWRR